MLLHLICLVPLCLGRSLQDSPQPACPSKCQPNIRRCLQLALQTDAGQDLQLPACQPAKNPGGLSNRTFALLVNRRHAIAAHIQHRGKDTSCIHQCSEALVLPRRSGTRVLEDKTTTCTMLDLTHSAANRSINKASFQRSGHRTSGRPLGLRF